MAVVIGKVGLSNNLGSAPVDNGFKYTTDTNELYLDFNVGGEGAKRVKVTPGAASDSQAGLVKIYETTGQNTDGVMSQKAITDIITEMQETITQLQADLAQSKAITDKYATILDIIGNHQ